MARRDLLVLIVAGALLAAGGCASGGSSSGTTGVGAPPSAAGAGTVPGAARCAWAVRADRATLNIAYPDTAATYWGLSYALAPGEHLELHGRYPAARYASFVSYGPDGGALDVLTDRDIDPEPGGTNPFRPLRGAAGTAPTVAGDSYTLTIRPDLGATDAANVLGAKADASAGASGTAPGTTVGATSGSAPGTTVAPGPTERILLGSGGPGAVGGTVLYRVYIPTDASDATGGAGLPEVRLVDAAGTSTPVPTCTKPGPSAAAVDIVNRFQRPITPEPATPIFIRPAGNNANLYPNPDNVYVATVVAHQPGKVVVVRGRAPTFPDTRNGAAVTGDEQVRYWSMCTNEFRTPYPVTACAADFQTALDAEGSYTYVISTPQDRPATTPADAGATWLDWGATDVDGLLLMRHMLADPAFPEAATNLAPGALAAGAMGAYAPRGAYCDKVVFEQGGYAACGL